MANVLIDDTNLTNIANAIREKNGTTTTYKPGEMAGAISAIETGGGAYAPRYISFYNYNVGDLDYEVANLDTSNMSSMKYMFYGCGGPTGLDLRHFNTSNVTDMSYMFASSNNLNTVNMTGLNTKNVTNMTQMFAGCTRLTTLEMTSIDTSSVTTTNRMLYNCSGLTKINLRSFTGANLTDTSQMFASCSSATEIDLGNLDFSNITSFSNMFYKVPTSCLIIVSDDDAKAWMATNFAAYTNVKTTVETGGGGAND